MPKISELPLIQSRRLNDILPIVQNSVTDKISIKNLMREPVINAGEISGVVNVDLSQGRWFRFILIGNVEVTLNNEAEGEEYLFWVYANSGFAVDSITMSSGRLVYAKSGNIPNPTNNAYNLYKGYVIDGGMVLTLDNNYSAL